MPRDVAYRSTEHNEGSAEADPYLRASFPVGDRLRRAVWNVCWLLLYRFSPRPLHGWRAMLLRMFGAKMGPDCHFYPGSKVYAPWHLECEAQVTAGDGVEIYNPATLLPWESMRSFRKEAISVERRMTSTTRRFRCWRCG